MVSTYSYSWNKKKLLAPRVHTALSERKLTSIASKSEVRAPPAEPVIQVLYRLSSVSEAL